MTPRETAASFCQKAFEVAPADPSQAYRLFASAVMNDPDYGPAWYELGNANANQGLLPAAVASLRRMLEAEPEHVAGMVNLAHRLFHNGKTDESRAINMRVLEMAPDNAHAWCNLSLVQSIDGQTSESLVSAKRAFDLDQSTVIEFALAFAYLYEDDWANGLKHYESRFPYALQRFAHYPYPKWRGEDIAGKRLLVIQEQGLGDAISFLRFIEPAGERCKSLELQVVPELVRIVAQIMAPYPHIEVGPLTDILPAADAWCTITDLPTALGLSNREIAECRSPQAPYASLASTVEWKVPNRKLHVGIAWAGDPRNVYDKWRSTTIETFLDLCRAPGIQLYSLQVGPRGADLHAAGCVGLVRDLTPYIRDVADTAAIVRDLDLVITVESALRHICGLLEVACWVPVARNAGDWRCGRRRVHPLWDPTTRLFRQGKDATWGPVFDRLTEALRERIDG